MQEKISNKQPKKDDRWISTACSMCYGNCSIRCHVVDGVLVNIEGNPDSSIGQGRICPKGTAGILTLYDPNRVKVPLRRTNPEKGIGTDPKWEQISWEEALDIITVKLKKIHDDDPRKLYFQFTTTTASGSRIGGIALRAAFGTPNTSTAGGGIHCGTGAHMTNGATHASWSLVPDFDYCNYAIYFGASKGHGAGHVALTNAAKVAEARDRGMKMIVVDPMMNFAAAKATEWVPIRVGTDGAMALAMINVLLNELGIWDAAYLKRYTNAPYLIRKDGLYLREKQSQKPMVWDSKAGAAKTFDDPATADFALQGEFQVGSEKCSPAFHLLKEHVKKYTPEMAEKITGISSGTIRRIAKEFGEAARIGSTITIDGVELPYRPVAAIFFRGAQGHRNSLQNCMALDLLNHLVGASEVPGGVMGFSPVCHGHPETGSPRYSPRPDKDGMMITGDWVVEHLPYPPHAAAPPKDVHMKGVFPMAMESALLVCKDGEKFRKQFKLPYEIEMIINYGANAVMSIGNKDQVAEELKKIPFIVSFDLFLNEFTDFADIVLPDVSYFERLDVMPNGKFIFSHPNGMGEWSWPIRQAVVEPEYERRYFSEVVLELAYRIGMGPNVNMVINSSYQLKGDNWLEPDRTYTNEVISDRILKNFFGPERGLEWFKEHGVIRWPKKVQEVYWKPFVPVRIPVYFEYVKRAGLEVREVAKQFGVELDYSHYEALPDWHPCQSHMVKDKDYDLWSFYYRDVLHTNSFTMENPLLDEASHMTPYTYRISINSAVARKKGIKDGDLIWVESSHGRKVKGLANVIEGIMPEALGIAACAGHWANGMPIAKNKGIFYNELIEIDYEHMDPANLNMDLCAKVKIYKAGDK